MTAEGTYNFLPIKEFSTHIQQELIRSTSEDYSAFHIIPRKAFVTHYFLKNENILRVISIIFDCMFGCGSSLIALVVFKPLEPFGPIMLIPVMAIVTFILGLNGFIYDGILNKLFQALIMIIFMNTFKIQIKGLFWNPPISYDSWVCCIIEKCVNCNKLFMQPFLSAKICICVCENCLRRSDECTKCRSSPCTGMYVY